MANFLLVFTGGGEVAPTEEERSAIVQDWGSWFTGLGENLVDPGNPIGPTAKTISSDGSVSESAVGEPATGYTIIQAASLAAATEAAKTCPHLKSGGKVTVYETFRVM